jgi:3-oxoacyl-[acyl-carrier protein] reductase
VDGAPNYRTNPCLFGLFAGKVALVTGSSRGIGAAIATLFAPEGAKVAVHGRDRAALAAVREKIAGESGHVLEVTGDVTRFEAIESMRGEIEGALGPIDVLVANAGGSRTLPGQSIDEIDEQGWRASIDANATVMRTDI